MSGEADSFSLGDSPGMTMSRDNVFMPGESPTGGEMVGTSVFLEAHPGDHGGDSERNPELISGSGSPYYHVAAEDRLPSSSGHQPEFEYTTSVSNSRAEIGPPPEEQYNFQFDDEALSVDEGVPGTRTHDDYFDDHFSPPAGLGAGYSTTSPHDGRGAAMDVEPPSAPGGTGGGAPSWLVSDHYTAVDGGPRPRPAARPPENTGFAPAGGDEDLLPEMVDGPGGPGGTFEQNVLGRFDLGGTAGAPDFEGFFRDSGGAGPGGTSADAIAGGVPYNLYLEDSSLLPPRNDDHDRDDPTATPPASSGAAPPLIPFSVNNPILPRQQPTGARRFGGGSGTTYPTMRAENARDESGSGANPNPVVSRTRDKHVWL